MINKIKGFLLLTLGATMDAAGFYFFLAPNDIAAGGITGASLVLNTFFPQLPLGLLVLIMSIILLIIGSILMGTAFGLKTVYCSIAIPLIIWFFEKVYPLSAPLANDILIQLFFGVLISGIGIAILFNQDASSGGTDILARILYSYYGVDMGKGLLMIDFFITIGAVFVFGLEKGMYALLGVILFGFVIDYAIEGLTISKHVTIITTEIEQVKDYIVQHLDRGATIYTAHGAYTDENRDVIVTIIKRREFIRLRNFIQDIDHNAFISVQNTHEVLGEGFLPINR
ncbi:MAG TPA: YitT family protein [Syntrophomonadaceae bacterium]|nr:YitT family protein [Syntrophomonadaceae bacterium]